MYACCQHFCRYWKVERPVCQCYDHMSHAALNWSHCCHPRGKPYLKMMHKIICKQVMKASRLRTWIIRTMARELSVETKITLIGSDGVKYVRKQPGEKNKDKVSGLQLSIMVESGVIFWGFMSATKIGEQQFIKRTMNTNIIMQRMLPSIWKVGHSQVFHYTNAC